MPEEGVQLTPKAHLMTLAERKRLISIFASLGVTKLRFTGGEPTISNQLEELIQHARSCNIKSIGITSNGIVLKERLDDLIKAGLTSVNISLDTLIDTKFASVTRRDKKNIYRVLSSVYTAVSKGLPVKINCVLMRGFNDNEIAQFVNLTKSVNVDFRFIELMPFDGNEWKPENFVSYIEVIDRLKNEYVSGISLRA
jgi:cyclic pyranopterin phosphate synthase